MSNPEFEVRAAANHNLATSVVEEIVHDSRGYAQGGERALLGALLFDGVQAYIGYALASTAAQRARSAEAFNWVMEIHSDEPFSFNGVCEALGISADYLRLGLANATTSLLHEVGRIRRNF